MSTSVSRCEPPKNSNSCVRPGMLEVRAKARRPLSALINDDLPILERPAKAISIPRGEGTAPMAPAAPRKFPSPANRRRPRSSSAAEKSDGSDVGLILTRPGQVSRLPLEPKFEPAVPPQARGARHYCG